MKKNVGVIVLTWNHINFTKQCMDYLLLNTPTEVPILIVDNGSEKETTNYLKSIENSGLRSDMRHLVSVIYNERNLGIAPALNQGIKWCQERKLDFCFVSNDCVVGKDWLTILQDGVYKHEKIGGGSPYVSPEFCYDGFCDLNFRESYRHNVWPRLKNDPPTEELNSILNDLHGGNFDDFTENWAKTRLNDPPYFEWSSMIMYLKLSTIEKIGLFDEQFVPSNWEDMDYIVRMNNAELYRVAVTGSYAFHWSNISNRNAFFDGAPEYRAEMSKNEQRFEYKWRVFLPHDRRNHSVRDGDKYPPKKVGPKLDEFFEVSAKSESRNHDQWYTWDEFYALKEQQK